MPHTIAVINQKGGPGKTTISTHLAAAAHLAGKGTLLLDLDPQASAWDWYQARSEKSKLSDLHVITPRDPLTPNQFRSLMKPYDVVVIDTPGSINQQPNAPGTAAACLSAAIIADIVIVPVEPAPFTLWSTDTTLKLLDDADIIRVQLDKPPIMRMIVLNQAEDSTRLTKQARELLSESPLYNDELRIQRAVAIPGYQGEGETMFMKPKSRAAKEFRRLYDAVSISGQVENAKARA